mmetsp:Transcript_8810/g.25268  ORF Transcript_8810/g.25268 Transcript_8810/m.25268 type:complete len:215 (-) Transcript_8810:153-797(-)
MKVLPGSATAPCTSMKRVATNSRSFGVKSLTSQSPAPRSQVRPPNKFERASGDISVIATTSPKLIVASATPSSPGGRSPSPPASSMRSCSKAIAGPGAGSYCGVRSSSSSSPLLWRGSGNSSNASKFPASAVMTCSTCSWSGSLSTATTSSLSRSTSPTGSSSGKCAPWVLSSLINSPRAPCFTSTARTLATNSCTNTPSLTHTKNLPMCVEPV